MDYLLMRLIGLMFPIDLLVFIITAGLIHEYTKIKNWGAVLLISFGIYIVIREMLVIIM